jgi:hypothetical protein
VAQDRSGLTRRAVGVVPGPATPARGKTNYTLLNDTIHLSQRLTASSLLLLSDRHRCAVRPDLAATGAVGRTVQVGNSDHEPCQWHSSGLLYRSSQ